MHFWQKFSSDVRHNICLCKALKRKRRGENSKVFKGKKRPSKTEWKEKENKGVTPGEAGAWEPCVASPACLLDSRCLLSPRSCPSPNLGHLGRVSDFTSSQSERPAESSFKSIPLLSNAWPELTFTSVAIELSHHYACTVANCPAMSKLNVLPLREKLVDPVTWGKSYCHGDMLGSGFMLSSESLNIVRARFPRL